MTAEPTAPAPLPCPLHLAFGRPDEPCPGVAPVAAEPSSAEEEELCHASAGLPSGWMHARYPEQAGRHSGPAARLGGGCGGDGGTRAGRRLPAAGERRRCRGTRTASSRSHQPTRVRRTAGNICAARCAAARFGERSGWARARQGASGEAGRGHPYSHRDRAISQCCPCRANAETLLVEAASQRSARFGLRPRHRLLCSGCVGAASMTVTGAVLVAVILGPMAWLILCGGRATGRAAPRSEGSEPRLSGPPC